MSTPNIAHQSFNTEEEFKSWMPEEGKKGIVGSKDTEGKKQPWNKDNGETRDSNDFIEQVNKGQEQEYMCKLCLVKTVIVNFVTVVRCYVAITVGGRRNYSTPHHCHVHSYIIMFVLKQFTCSMLVGVYIYIPVLQSEGSLPEWSTFLSNIHKQTARTKTHLASTVKPRTQCCHCLE